MSLPAVPIVTPPDAGDVPPPAAWTALTPHNNPTPAVAEIILNLLPHARPFFVTHLWHAEWARSIIVYHPNAPTALFPMPPPASQCQDQNAASWAS